jgi:hypothetical protein
MKLLKAIKQYCKENGLKIYFAASKLIIEAVEKERDKQSRT